MKHAGEARRAALRLILLTLAAVCAVGLLGLALGWAGMVAKFLGHVVIYAAAALASIWILFSIFTFYFFRDPNAKTPEAAGLIVSPGHGKVDAVDRLTESQFPGGPCHRISIFLSVIDIHVQCAPVSGRVVSVTHTAGKFISALQSDSALYNENVLIGVDSTQTPGEKIGVRLIAGVLARRIVPFIKAGDEVQRGQRISLIQFGSRCDLYVPLDYQIKVKIGDKVVGGETVAASKS
ncbi:MAG TPA: phosphatidylserine decarboxylase [Verrucomicrobiae bacterium]|jgi:phosphatidylserine decarboxylase